MSEADEKKIKISREGLLTHTHVHTQEKKINEVVTDILHRQSESIHSATTVSATPIQISVVAMLTR